MCATFALLTLVGCGGSGEGPTVPAVSVSAVQLSGVPDTLVVGESVSASATATLSSGESRLLTSGWSANPNSSMSVTANGSGVRITPLSTGTTTLTVSDGGKSASKVVAILAVRYRSLTLSMSDTLRVGRVATPVVTGTTSGGTTSIAVSPVFISSNSSVVSVSGTTITAVAPGTTDLLIQGGGVTLVRRIVVQTPPVAVDFRAVGAVSPAILDVAKQAAARWEDVFATAWFTGTVTFPVDLCLAGQPAMNGETISGLRVYITVDNALANGAEARAGICVSQNGCTVVGKIILSTAAATSPTARLLTVIKHELGHVLGFPTGALSSGVPGTNPRFTGTEARNQFVLAGGTDADGVPLETTAEVPGGEYFHWRLSQIPGEIMTAYGGASTARPDGGALSAITLGALKDMGYPIRMSAADPSRVNRVLTAQLPNTAVFNRILID